MVDEQNEGPEEELELTEEEQAAELQEGESEEESEELEGEEGGNAEEEARLAKFAEDFPELADELIKAREEREAREAAAAEAAKKTGAPAEAVNEDDAAADDQYLFERDIQTVESELKTLSGQFDAHVGEFKALWEKANAAVADYVEKNRNEMTTDAEVRALRRDAENELIVQEYRRQAEGPRQRALAIMRIEEDKPVGPLAIVKEKLALAAKFKNLIEKIPEAKKFPSLYADMIHNNEIDPRAMPSAQRKILQAKIAEKVGGKKPGPPQRTVSQEKAQKLLALRGVKVAKGSRQGLDNGAGGVKSGGQTSRPVIRSRDPVVNKALDKRNFF